MDPSQEVTVLSITFLSKPARTPRQMALNLTVLSNPGNSHFPAVSGSPGCVIEKGPLIAGFSVKCSRISIIDPFPGYPRKVTKTGSNRVQNRVQDGQKWLNTGPIRP